MGPGRTPSLISLYALYLTESVLSVGWAYLIFKIFNDGTGSLRDVGYGYRKYFLKAFGVSALTGLVFGLSVYNILFYFSLHSAHRFLDLLLAGFVVWALLFWVAASLYQWPLIFFQDPSLGKVFYRSFLLAVGDGLAALTMVALFAVCSILFSAVFFLWFFIGPAFLFSFQCVALEKQLLKYKITYGDKPLEPFLEQLETERRRGWKDIFRPWEDR